MMTQNYGWNFPNFFKCGLSGNNKLRRGKVFEKRMGQVAKVFELWATFSISFGTDLNANNWGSNI